MTAAPPTVLRTMRTADGVLWLRAEDVTNALRVPAASMVLKAAEVEATDRWMADLYRLTARALQYRADEFDAACIAAVSTSPTTTTPGGI